MNLLKLAKKIIVVVIIGFVFDKAGAQLFCFFGGTEKCF